MILTLEQAEIMFSECFSNTIIKVIYFARLKGIVNYIRSM